MSKAVTFSREASFGTITDPPPPEKTAPAATEGVCPLYASSFTDQRKDICGGKPAETPRRPRRGLVTP